MFIKKIVKATGLYQTIGKGCNVKKSWMSLKELRKNLNKATTVAAIVGIATCLLPASAQAQVRRLTTFVEVNVCVDPSADEVSDENEIPCEIIPPLPTYSVAFSLEPSVEDVNSLDFFGEFPGAILDLNVVSENDNLDRFFPSGTLLTTRLTTDPTTGNFPGLSFGYEAITNNDFPSAAFNNDGLRYDFIFDNRSEVLTLFIPSNDSSLINSLSSLPNFLDSIQVVQGVVSYSDVGIEQRFLLELQSEIVTVSEPTATASLLGVGVLGAILLHKRNKRLRKSI